MEISSLRADTTSLIVEQIIEPLGQSLGNVWEPTAEASVRGPSEGFVEDITRNVDLIRKRLKNGHLVFEPAESEHWRPRPFRSHSFMCFLANIYYKQVQGGILG
ncbi:spore germination protein [Paenibacillus sedimenti]|uniref:Spore germination protein n=1 Tax=Paenibacillus sedimenti TaxID=2770274 RepID=A0A926QLT6_9BACL|nr:spore germination protein [Paenibacillus sedimenti]MBD0383173.1 spore germination protein [Paenibacillus sedimenti]